MMMNDATTMMNDILSLSHHYGAGEEWVIAGGGNSSCKDETHLWIKASGSSLRTLTAEQMVQLERSALDRIWHATYPDDTDAREAAALADLLSARTAGQGTLRPSVETMMHGLFPHTLVLHTHPTVVNGLTCGVAGMKAFQRNFADRGVWIPTMNPGFVLARYIQAAVAQWRSAHDGTWPRILILQNHGLVVAANTVAEIHQLQQEVLQTVAAEIHTRPAMEPLQEGPAHLEEMRDSVTEGIATFLAAQGQPLTPPHTISFTLPELENRMNDPEAVNALSAALSPDHIVYSGHKPCIIRPTASRPHGEIIEGIMNYCHEEEVCPRIVIVEPYGAFAVGTTPKKAHLAQLLFLDALSVHHYATFFGGARGMPDDQISFIRNWEVEAFREQASTM
jgi:rhamnose utilization protein RhaD (predicted bifunctional aldolase and dehydrogenase)